MCYWFDLDFGNAFENAAGLLGLYITVVSFIAIALVVVVRAGKNGNRQQKRSAKVIGFLIFGTFILLYFS